MIDNIITMWFLFILIGLTPLNYKALMALDFVKLFKKSSTWQIRTILTFVSISLAFLIALCFKTVFEELFHIITSA